MRDFFSGFEKRAGTEELMLGALLGAGALGVGALGGHGANVGKKMDYARAGKEYKPQSFTDKHPIMTGAASLGIAPGMSRFLHQRKLDMENPKVRKILDQHPMAAAPGY